MIKKNHCYDCDRKRETYGYLGNFRICKECFLARATATMTGKSIVLHELSKKWKAPITEENRCPNLDEYDSNGIEKC